MKGRTIIRGQSMVISAMLTAVFVRAVYPDVHAWRLMLLYAALCMMTYRIMMWIIRKMLRGGKDDKETGGKGGAGTVPGVKRNKVRFRKVKQTDRDTACDLIQIS